MSLFKLDNTVQKYSWGSCSYIPDLLKIDNPDHEPFAEVWMGAHRKAPSRIADENKDLISHIERNPIKSIGNRKTLPFLFKLLAAGAPLSIQAHPNKEEAVAGYENENDRGIPLDSPLRNYRDTNHKPEILCAQTAFWALCGFRFPEEIKLLLDDSKYESIRSLTEFLTDDDLEVFFRNLMCIPGDLRNIICRDAFNASKIKQDYHWKWVGRLYESYPDDIGILSPLFLNLVKLNPEEAMYLPDGVLHAYLEGMGVELMANSDNVLRCGLTGKHVDVDELMNVLSFQPMLPEILRPEITSGIKSVYRTPAAEFELSVIKGSDTMLPVAFDNESVSILLNMADAVDISDGSGGTLRLNRGESLFAEEQTKRVIVEKTYGSSFTLYRAGVPV